MANFKTPTYAANIQSVLGLVPALRVDPRYYSASRQGYCREYFLTSTSGASTGDAGADSAGRTIDIDQDDNLLLCIVPKGSIMVPGNVAFGAFGAGCTLIIGLYPYDGDNTDGLNTTPIDADIVLASTDISSAGVAVTSNKDTATSQTMLYEVTADAVLIATLGGGSAADAKYLRFDVRWINPQG